MEFRNKKFLIISTEHFSFIKDQTEFLAPFVGEIHQLVRYNPIAGISGILPINALKNYQKNRLIDLTGTPDNVKVYPIPVYYAPMDFSYRSLGKNHLKSVRRCINQKHIFFDIIHAHGTWSSGYVGAKLKEKYGLPLVITAHGYDIYDLPFQASFWKVQVEKVLNSADKIITVSEGNARCIQKLNCRTPVSVIPNGFNQNLFYPRNAGFCRKLLGLPQDKRIVLSVGSLEPIKGHETLVRAMDQIRKKRNDVICYIIGDGSEMHHLRTLIKKLGLSNEIKLMGSKRHHEIPIWIGGADIFVLPSIQESFGVVQIEALACGKPVVCTMTTGSSEVIVSDEYGLLTPVNDYHRLSENILQALNSSWDHEKITEYAKRFSYNNITRDLLNTYSELIQ